ncbi:MAG TPA: nicotinate (nicotinamide) nucleotide adenylyltransferase [Haloplasmataceae bacterium]
MIILYGGSFNPPTVAHYEISAHLISKYHPKAFIFIPVGNNYNKDNLIPFYHRYEMLKIVAKKLPNAYVSDFENQEVYKGTITTLDHFQALYKSEMIYYVIGADNLVTITTWINYERLLKDYHFIVLKRNNLDVKNFINQNELLNKYLTSFIVEDDFKETDVQASDYRILHKDEIVLKEVNEYIYKYHLYGRGDENA